jgi:uncharacterized phage-associated protein
MSAVNVFDVAEYILQKHGPMTTMKLQKLVYYSQAWSLVWDEESLFPERIEAWENGPVVRELYNCHKGQFKISTTQKGYPENLSGNQKDTINRVLDYYGEKKPQWLSDLTHMEAPWKNTQLNSEITHADMSEYYCGLQPV